LLAESVSEIAVARVAPESDLLHVDCMDGHYVPNLSIGPPVVKSLRKHTDLFLDCHLMVSNPAVLLAGFADAGADGCTVHVELGDPRPQARLVQHPLQLRGRDRGTGLPECRVVRPGRPGREVRLRR